MADIQALTASARSKLASGDAISRVDAAYKAVRGSGVFHPADVKRLAKRVCSELGKGNRRRRRRHSKRGW